MKNKIKKHFILLFIDIDECEPVNPCENGGTCENQPGGYSCNCENGYTGQKCEQGTYCMEIN